MVGAHRGNRGSRPDTIGHESRADCCARECCNQCTNLAERPSCAIAGTTAPALAKSHTLGWRDTTAYAFSCATSAVANRNCASTQGGHKTGIGPAAQAVRREQIEGWPSAPNRHFRENKEESESLTFTEVAPLRVVTSKRRSSGSCLRGITIYWAVRSLDTIF